MCTDFVAWVDKEYDYSTEEFLRRWGLSSCLETIEEIELIMQEPSGRYKTWFDYNEEIP